MIAPLGSLLSYGQSVNAGLAAIPFTYISANEASYAMGGVIVGGPDVVDTIATQQYSNNGIALPALNVRQLLARPTNRPSRFVFHSIFREGGSIIARAAWGKKDHIVERRLPPASTG